MLLKTDKQTRIVKCTTLKKRTIGIQSLESPIRISEFPSVSDFQGDERLELELKTPFGCDLARKKKQSYAVSFTICVWFLKSATRWSKTRMLEGIYSALIEKK